MDYYLQYVLDSTMTTLEPVWKPRLTSGAPFAEDNPAGLAFVLERLEPGELASVKRSDPVYEALVSRPGIDPALRRDALDVLAKRTGVSMGTALLAVVGHVAATPGAGAATADLMRLLADMPAADLAAQRPALENLARTGALDTVRQGALLALLRLDGSADAVWRLTGVSARLRVDLLRAAAQAPEGPGVDSLRTTMLAWLQEAAATGAALAPPQPPVTGRYVRLVRPGRATVLSVTEVQVFSGGENVAMKGSATQSSTLAGGATGGHAARAIDGGLEPELPAGTDPLKGTVQFTSPEQDPWWELDLGAERPIETIALWPGAADTRTGLHLSILDANRKPVFVQDGLRLQAPMHAVDLGGDLEIAAPGRGDRRASGDSRPRGGHRAAARDAGETAGPAPGGSGGDPTHAGHVLPSAQVPALTGEVLRDLGSIPAVQRTGPAVAETFALGRELIARLPDEADRKARAAQLDALLVRVIRIETVPAQMKYDVSRFTVAAGETVVIELVNKDEMPHNLVVGKEGALEAVGLAAEKMIALPDAFAKSFVPSTPEVLFSIRLLNPGETLQARFTAPAQPGNYPFVCTFPAHWRTMNGVIDVRRPPPPSPSHEAPRRDVPAMTRPVSLLLVIVGAVARRRGAGGHRARSARGLRHRRRRVPVRDHDADDRGDPREAARHAHVGRVCPADAADQGPHRRPRGARHRRPDGDVHALPGAARRRAEPHPGLRQIRQADRRLPHQHARVHVPGRQPARRPERRLRPRRVRAEVDHPPRPPVDDHRGAARRGRAAIRSCAGSRRSRPGPGCIT